MALDAAGRTLKRMGRDVTIRNYSESGTDRPNITETDGSPYTVKARVDYKAAPQQIADSFGTDVDIDVDVFIAEDSAGGVSEITDGAGESASEVDVDGVTMIVMLKDVQDNGLMRLSCVREA